MWSFLPLHNGKDSSIVMRPFECVAAPDGVKWGEHVSTRQDKKAAPPVRLARPRLRLMRRRCHTDHTYCCLVLFLNLFPRLLDCTHSLTHSRKHARRQARTHTSIDVCTGLHLNSPGLSQPIQSAVASRHSLNQWQIARGLRFCGGKFLKVIQNLLDLPRF